MFAKLLKHELRSTGTVVGVLSAIAIGLGVLGGFDFMFMVKLFEESGEKEPAAAVFAILLMLGLFAIFIGLFAYAIGSFLFVLIRFYRNKFTDEGYLTFTLPVNAHQVFLSSWMGMVIWDLVITVVMIVAIFTIVSLGLLPVKDAMLDSMEEAAAVYPFIFDIAADSAKETLGTYSVFYVIEIIVQLLLTPLLCMTSIVLGATVAKKHKLLAAVGFYYLINMISNAVLSLVSVIAFATSISAGAMEEVSRITVILQPLLQIVMGTCAYLLSVHLMGKKLNLP